MCLQVRILYLRPDPPAIFCSTLACLSEFAGMKPSHLVVMSVRLNAACSGCCFYYSETNIQAEVHLYCVRCESSYLISRHDESIQPSACICEIMSSGLISCTSLFCREASSNYGMIVGGGQLSNPGHLHRIEVMT